MTEAKHYKAFISYSHSDERWARWLQRSLEKYKLPKTFRQSHPELPERLYPIFRDRDELASGGELSDSIRKAMENSEALIVICSPAARASQWVNEEIKRFKASGRGDRIFCFLVSGSPDANSPKCAFPAAILQDENGYVVHEPLAGDATPKGDGKRNAMLKVAAGLLGVGVDDLKQRDAQRQARFWSYIALGTTFIAALTIGLAIYAFNAKRESEMRRQQAEGLIGFMLGDLRKKLEPIGKLDILDAVGDQAMAYFATLGERGTSKEMLSRAVALKQIGDVRFNQGELEPALRAFKQSLAQAEALHKSEPMNNDYLFELGQAEFWVGYVAWQRGELESAYPSFQKYMSYSEELAKRAPDNVDYQLELSYAHSNLGALALALKKPELALERFQTSASYASTLLKGDAGNVDLAMNLADTQSWIGTTYLELGNLADAKIAFNAAIATMLPFQQKGEDKRASSYYARLLALAADADISSGDIDSARREIEKSIAVHDYLLKNDPSNAKIHTESQIPRLLKVDLSPIVEWTDADLQKLNQNIREIDGMLVTQKGDVDLLTLHAKSKSRYFAYSAIKSPSPALQTEAEAYLVEWQKQLTGKTKASEILLAEAQLELSVGLVLSRTGKSKAATALWQAGMNRLSKLDSRNLAFIALRRQYALNLNDRITAAALEKQLIKAGFNDPRNQPVIGNE
jgi:eukaryotic-like serine/threonine-protein kinase